MKLNLSGRYGKYIPYVVCILAAAVFLVIVSDRPTPRPTTDLAPSMAEEGGAWVTGAGSGAGEPDLVAFQKHLSQVLTDILSRVDGAGAVQAEVMLELSPQYFYHERISSTENETVEEDAQGGTRQVLGQQTEGTLSLVRDSGGVERPVVVGVQSAQIRGVLVVAEGARDPRVKVELAGAVITLLDVAAHRVIVLPGRGGD